MIVIIHPHTRKIDRDEEKFLLLLSALFGLLIALLCKVQSVLSTIYLHSTIYRSCPNFSPDSIFFYLKGGYNSI